MNLQLLETKREDAAILTKIMTASFNYDTAFYFGEGKTDGPPGYADGTLATKVLEDSTKQTWFICLESEKIGFVSINFEHWEVCYFCILPAFINQGVGTATWKQLEAHFGIRPWFLETPGYSTRNHAFYEKIGFAKVKEKEYPNGAVSFVYEKIRN